MKGAELDRNGDDEGELVVYFPTPARRSASIFSTLAIAALIVFVGSLPVSMFIDLFSSSTDLSTDWLILAFLLALFIPCLWALGFLGVRVVVFGARCVRGDWWLHLSANGFEVNDRPRTPRRYAWSEIEKFMLVATTDPKNAVVAPAMTAVEVAKSGGSRDASLLVGFCFTPPGRRRTVKDRLWRIMSGPPRARDGTKADGLIMGYWDRPFEEAVDLMNEWLTRHRAA